MKRGWARTLALTSLLPLLASLGCDALSVRTFAGTVMEFTISGVTAQTLTPSQHLELWARTKYDDIVRIEGYYDLPNGKSSPGLMIRQAISLKDPCMIDGYYFANNANGNLLTTAAAYATASNAGGVAQTPDQLAQQVVDRIDQLAGNPTIQTGSPLLAIVPYDPNVPPAVPDTATSTDRRAACDSFIQQSPNTYIGNPYQITAPLHGTVYGFPKFVTVTPPANYDGFRIDSPTNLKGVREIFFTVEGSTVDPMNRGPLFMTSTMTQNGQGVVYFNLTHADPMGTASGTAALLVDLDEDPVQF